MTTYIVTFQRKKHLGFPRKRFESVDAEDKRSAVQAARKLAPGCKPDAVAWDGGECAVTAICDACDQAIFAGEDCAVSEDSGWTCGECLQAVRKGNSE